MKVLTKPLGYFTCYPKFLEANFEYLLVQFELSEAYFEFSQAQSTLSDANFEFLLAQMF